MNETYSLSLPTKEFQVAVKNLHKLLSKIKPKPSYPILDVVVKLEAVELRMIGMALIIKCKHKNIFSFTIPFHDFYVAALGTDGKSFIAEVSAGEITIGNRSLSSDYIKLFHPENLQKLELQMNSSVIDILSLRYKFTYEELEEKNYVRLIEKEEENLDLEIYKGLKFLSKYGITYSLLRKIIDQNIQGKGLTELSNN
jgi:hypothetical protein